MTTTQEFAHIARQLEWLEAHLRSQVPAPAGERMADALGALACARAVVTELAEIGSRPAPEPVSAGG